MVDGLVDAFSYDGALLPLVASVFTPYQLLFLERLWTQIEPRPLLILDSRGDRFREGRPPAIAGAQVISLSLTGAATDPSQVALIQQGIAAAEAFVADRRFVFTASSYQWPLNIGLYSKQRRNPRCRFLLVDDGLSTYLEIKRSMHELGRNFAREMLLKWRGLPARASYPGHPLGHDIPELHSIIVGLSDLPPQRGRRRYFSLTPSDGALTYTSDACLFIGQPYLRDYDARKLRPFIERIGADLSGRGFKRIGFKPHHFQSGQEIDYYLSMGFELVDPPIPVEEMIADSGFRTIASINSSALLTTRSLFGEGVRAIAYGPSVFKPAQEKRDLREVESIFRRAGVEIVDMN